MDESETGNLIAETASKIFKRYSEINNSNATEIFNLQFWQELEDSGLTNALEPYGKGEMGIATFDGLNLIRLSGYYALNLPFAETLMANYIAQYSNLETPIGPLALVIIKDNNNSKFIQENDNFIINGVINNIPWGRNAANYCVIIENDDDVKIAIINSNMVEVKNINNIANEPRDTILFSSKIPKNHFKTSNLSIEKIELLCALMRSLQMSGAIDRILELTLNYCPTRVQFGQQITKFQAIQHNIAQMASHAAAAKIAANYAAINFEGNNCENAIAAAKIRVGEAAGFIASLSHQTHGAIGFTQDYFLHNLTRRIWSWRDEFGTESYWSKKLGNYVCTGNGDYLWPFITSQI